MPLVAGCGLVFVPVSRGFPGTVKSIRVVDENTHESIADAHVSVQIHNDTLRSPLIVKDKGLAESVWYCLEAREGAFAMEPQTTTAWHRIGFPLGPTVADEPFAVLRVTAPCYKGAWYSYSPESPPQPGIKYTATDADLHNIPPFARFDEHGVLTIYLAREPAPSHSASASSTTPPAQEGGKGQ